MGRSITSGGEPKVSKGERREARARWAQSPKAVSDPEFRQTTSGAHGSAGRADCLPRGKPFGAPAGANPCPLAGLDADSGAGEGLAALWDARLLQEAIRRGAGGERKAPCIASLKNNFAVSKSPWRGLTRRLRRELGLAVPRGAHTFLSVAKEKCAKESQRHGDYGKKASIAHFDGGARYVARSMVGQLTPTIVRARSSPFSAVKMGGPFSLRCLSPLCSPAVGGGQAYPLRVKMVPMVWRSCSAKE